MANSDLIEILNNAAAEVGLTALGAATTPTTTQGVLFTNLMVWTATLLCRPQKIDLGTLTAGRSEKLTTLQARATKTDVYNEGPPPVPVNGYVALPTSPRPICYLEININGYPGTEVSYRGYLTQKADTIFVPTVTNPIYCFDRGYLYYYPVNAVTNSIIFKYLSLAADMAVNTGSNPEWEVFPLSKDVIAPVTEGVKALTHAQALNNEKMQVCLLDFIESFFGTGMGKQISGLVGVSQQLIPTVRI